MTLSESSLVDHIDLMADEFKRIKALNPGPEIIDLCDRALLVTQQNVPVVEQRDRLETEVNRLRARLASGLDEKQAERVARAFWRRIYPYRNDYDKELPYDCPVEFTANMATALCALECPPNSSPNGDSWIKCSQRLPKTGEKVVCLYAGVYGPRLVTFWYDYNLNPHFGTPSEPDGKGSQPATHWISLPDFTDSELPIDPDSANR